MNEGRQLFQLVAVGNLAVGLGSDIAHREPPTDGCPCSQLILNDLNILV